MQGQLNWQRNFLQDNIKGISRESDNFAQMFYYCGIIYGLDDIYNCGDYEFVKVGIEVRSILLSSNGDMDDELEADLYDKLTNSLLMIYRRLSKQLIIKTR